MFFGRCRSLAQMNGYIITPARIAIGQTSGVSKIVSISFASDTAKNTARKITRNSGIKPPKLF